MSPPGGGFGGAERLYAGLGGALAACGLTVERIDVVNDESSFDRILETYLVAYDLDLSAFDGVISTKAPSYAVRHRNHVGYLMHTLRYVERQLPVLVSSRLSTSAIRCARQFIRLARSTS